MAEAGRWLAMALEDRRAVDACLAVRPPIVSAAVLHSQQAAEKLMKAVLAHAGRPFRKTHDLFELARAVADARPELADLAAPLAELTPWHLLGRYPGPFGFEALPDEADVRAALPAIDALAAAVQRLFTPNS
jgi:HEPN domain-containing protein